MAQTATAGTSHAADLKELYSLPPVRALNDKSWIHDNIVKSKATDVDFSGKYVRFPVTVRRALGRGSRGEAGDLPINIEEVEVEAKAYIKQHYYALEWAETLELVSKNKEGAFESFVTKKMKNVGTDLAKDLNRQWYNPTVGRLALCTTDDSAGLTFTVDNAQYIQVGDIIDVHNTSTGAVITAGKARLVTAVNRSTNVITIDTNATVYSGADSGNINVAGTETVCLTGNYGNESEGLRSFADTSRSLHGIDSSTYEEWDGNEINLSGTPVIGESSIERIDDKVGRRGRGDVDVHLTTRGIRRRLADEFAAQRRYLNEKATDIKAGYKVIEVNGVDTVIDDDCPEGYFFAGRTETLALLKLTEPGFLETEAGDGALIELKNGTVAGTKKAVFQAWYRYHVSLACQDPGGWGMITGGEDDTTE